MFMYSVAAGSMIRLWIANLSALPDQQIEKNWAPYVHPTSRSPPITSSGGIVTSGADRRFGEHLLTRTTLRFIYSFGLLRATSVLELTDLETGECKIVLGSPTATYDKTSPVLGSTHLFPLMYPWYVGVGHTRGRRGDFKQLPPLLHATKLASTRMSHRLNPQQEGTMASEAKQAVYKRMYRSVPIVFNAETLELQFGSPITFPSPAHKNAIPWARDGQEEVFRDVQFPYDLKMRGNYVYIGVEFQDRCPSLVRMNLTAFCASLPKPI